MSHLFKRTRFQTLALLGAALLLPTAPALAASKKKPAAKAPAKTKGGKKAVEAIPDFLADIDLNALADMEVTSVAKKAQKLSETPAAVTVLTRDDLEKTGVTALADALRLVPGLDVGQLEDDIWHVASRSFNGTYTGKLLVLVDGRSVYTPAFGGVYWDALDFNLEDIDRVEIIRGPGGTLWGANAVNGVINILTRSTQDTLGGVVRSVLGDEERHGLNLRHGDKLGQEATYRVWLNEFARDGFNTKTGAENENGYRQTTYGAKVEWTPRKDTLVKFDAEAYTGYSKEFTNDLSHNTFAPVTGPYTVAKTGGHVLTRYERTKKDGEKWSLQVYHQNYDLKAKKNTLGTGIEFDGVSTWDLDLQHRFKLAKRSELTWGLGLRQNEFHMNPGNDIAITSVKKANDHIESGFVQMEKVLKPNRWKWTIGAKFERNTFTEFEWQPSTQLVFTPNSKTTWWGGLSRVVRTPTFFETYVDAPIAIFPPPAGAVVLGNPAHGLVARLLGNPNLKAENVTSLEGGVRTSSGENLTLDLAGFVMQVENQVTAKQGAVNATVNQNGVTTWVIDQQLQNAVTEKNLWGLEATTRWKVSGKTLVTGTWGYIDDRRKTDIVGFADNKSPRNHASVQVASQLSHRWQFTPTLYYTSGRQHATNPAVNVKERYRLDTALHWQKSKNFKLSMVAHNLLDQRREEVGAFNTNLGVVDTQEVPRSVFTRLSWWY